jgi:hypothetical protein
MMHHYYLASANATSTDTIYVVDATDRESAGYLVERLGCERVTREQALRVDRCHRHTGRGTAWAQSEGRVNQAGAAGYRDAVQLRAAIADAADGTLETIDFYLERRPKPPSGETDAVV